MRVLSLLLLLLPGLAGAQAPANPSLGLNLAGISDWSTEHPFLDIMRTARPWIGHEPGRWGAWDSSRLAAEGYLDARGYPRALPPGVERLEAFVLTDQPEAAASLAGTYVLRWEGRATVEVAGLAQAARTGPREIRFAYRPGPGLVAVAVTAIDPADPLRAMTLVRQDHLALWEAGAVFEPGFLRRTGAARSLRLMDWMATNGSTQAAWEDRPRPDDFTWAAKGVPVEVLVRLANEAGADPWFTLPHAADDAYVEAFATFVHDHLDPRLKAYSEWSNEVWNWTFPQAAWARGQARARWGEGAPDDAWMQFAGLRAAEVADTWARTFADAPDRLVRVVAVQTGWPGLEDPLLDAPLAVAEGREPPSRSFDAYAVTGYFGHGVASEEGAPALRAALAEGNAAALAERIARADIADLRDRLWPYHAAAAARRGLRLVAYEAGTHAVGQGPVVDDEAITAFLTEWSYSPAMGGLYEELRAAWEASGGTLLAPFVDVAAASRWGSWGALRHPDDRNPRWDALVAWNASRPSWEEERDPAAFAAGQVVEGTAGADAIAGTPEEDVVLSGDGDDALALAGADMADGGEGRDVATLPGASRDWTATREGGRTLMTRGWEVVRLTRVEEVRFAATGEVLMLEGAP